MCCMLTVQFIRYISAKYIKFIYMLYQKKLFGTLSIPYFCKLLLHHVNEDQLDFQV